MREPPRREVPELPGTKMPKYGISVDKLILPMGYPYPMGNYPWVWVIWLPIPVRVRVAIFLCKTRGYYPWVTHGLPMSSLSSERNVNAARSDVDLSARYAIIFLIVQFS